MYLFASMNGRQLIASSETNIFSDTSVSPTFSNRTLVISLCLFTISEFISIRCRTPSNSDDLKSSNRKSALDGTPKFNI